MTSPTTDIVAPWSLGGYAPGSYMCICVSCDKAHEADKRSTQCIDCAAREAAALISSLVAERDAAQRDAQIAQGFFAIEADKHSEWLENYMVMKAQAETAERLLAEARESHAAARQNFITMQQAAAVLLKRVEKASEHLGDIIRAYDANSGAEPSVSVLARAVDEARATLSIGGVNG